VYDDDLFWGGFSGYVGGSFALNDSGQRTLDFVPGLGDRYYVYVTGGSVDLVDYRLEITADDPGSGDRAINQPGVSGDGDFPATPEELFFSDDGQASLFDGEPLAGSLGGNDRADVFNVYAFLASEGRVLLDTRGGASVLNLLDEFGNVISTVSIEADFSGSLPPYFVPEDELLFFELVPENAANGLDYTISFDYLTGDGTSDYLLATDERLEAGATGASAPMLDLLTGVATVEGEIGFVGDERDLYRIVVPDGGVLRVTSSGLGQTAFLALYDDDGAFLAAHQPAEGALVSEIETTVSGASEYFLNIENSRPAAYTIDIELLAEAGGPYVPAEGSEDVVVDAGSSWFLRDARGTPGSAAFLALNVDGDRRIDGTVGGLDGNAHVDSADTYRMVAPAGGLVSVALEGLTADLDLYLYDRSGSLLASSIVGGAGSENLVVQLDRGEVFFISVEPFAGAESDYTLTVDGPAPVAGQERSDQELLGDAGGPLMAVPVELSGAGDIFLEGSMVAGEDLSDAFLFTAPASGRATFRLDGLFAALGVDVINAATGAVLLESRTRDNEALQRTFEVTAGDR
jgi:hypothetical protein